MRADPKQVEQIDGITFIQKLEWKRLPVRDIIWTQLQTQKNARLLLFFKRSCSLYQHYSLKTSWFHLLLLNTIIQIRNKILYTL